MGGLKTYFECELSKTVKGRALNERRWNEQSIQKKKINLDKNNRKSLYHNFTPDIIPTQ